MIMLVCCEPPVNLNILDDPRMLSQSLKYFLLSYELVRIPSSYGWIERFDDHSIFGLIESGGRTNIVFHRNHPHDVMRMESPPKKEKNKEDL